MYISDHDLIREFFVCKDFNNNDLSNIDFAADTFLCDITSNSFSAIKDRFMFPGDDKAISSSVDKRYETQIFSDKLNIINNKIPEDMKDLWSEICQYDVGSPCYFRSGLKFGVNQMKQFAKDYKVKTKTDLDPLSHMPSILKNGKHAASSPSKDKPWEKTDPCSYNSEVSQDSSIYSPARNPSSPAERKIRIFSLKINMHCKLLTS